MLNVACTNEEKVEVTSNPQTANKRPATLDGPLTITVQSGDGTFTQDPGSPNTFFAVSGDNPGETVYLVEGDADLGSGVETISDTVVLVVAGAKAANFGLSAGAPVPK